MKGSNTFTLDSFKDALKTDASLMNKLCQDADIVEKDQGRMVIHRKNITKYLEEYMCKNEDDLSDTLYFSYGIFLKVVD